MSDETTQNSKVIKAEPVTPVPAVQLELLQIILKAILSEPAKYILISLLILVFVGTLLGWKRHDLRGKVNLN